MDVRLATEVKTTTLADVKAAADAFEAIATSDEDSLAALRSLATVG